MDPDTNVLGDEHLLVVAAGPGIGAALARRGAHAGARVTVVARRASTLDPIIEELAAQGCDVAAVLVDASHQLAFIEALTTLLDSRGAPTLAVYNAVDPQPAGPPTEVDPEGLTWSLETNITAALVFAQQVVPAMVAAGRGTLMLTGGVLATKPWAPMTALSIGKAGMRALALCLHQELREGPVRALTVTVGGSVRAGGAFDPDAIAARMWHAHVTADAGDHGEITYGGPRDTAPSTVQQQ